MVQHPRHPQGPRPFRSASQIRADIAGQSPVGQGGQAGRLVADQRARDLVPPDLDVPEHLTGPGRHVQDRFDLRANLPY